MNLKIGSALLVVLTCAGCHEQKLAGAQPAAPAQPPPISLFSSGFQTDILQSPALVWPPGSVADIVLTSSLPIEVIDAPVGQWVDKGRTVLTFQVHGVGRAMTVTGYDIDRDRFSLQAAQLKSNQELQLAEQNVTAAREELKEARSTGVSQSHQELDQAQRALARARSESESDVASAQARLDHDQANLHVGGKFAEVSELDAPITGTVVSLKANQGKSAGAPGTVVGEIADSDQVRVRAGFEDQFRSAAVPHEQVQVEFAGDPNFIVPGEIEQTDPNTNTVTIKLIDQGHLVRPTSKIVAVGLKTTG